MRINPDTCDVSQEEAAKLIGTCRKTVQRIESEDSFWERVFTENRKINRRANPAVWRSMLKKAVDGSFFHQNLYFEMTGQKNDKDEIPENINFVVNVNYNKKEDINKDVS